jgi:hypothetical protein
MVKRVAFGVKPTAAVGWRESGNRRARASNQKTARVKEAKTALPPMALPARKTRVLRWGEKGVCALGVCACGVCVGSVHDYYLLRAGLSPKIIKKTITLGSMPG